MAIAGEKKALTFQELLFTLQKSSGPTVAAVLQQPYDIEVGAGTMSPDTFLRVLGPEAGAHRLCTTLSASCRRAVWGESESAVSAYAAAGDFEAATGECAGAVS